MLRNSNYLSIRASIKHINTPQGCEELKTAQHPPEWIMAVPTKPNQRPVTMFFKSGVDE